MYFDSFMMAEINDGTLIDSYRRLKEELPGSSHQLEERVKRQDGSRCNCPTRKP